MSIPSLNKEILMLLLNRNNVYRVLASTWTCPASTIIGMPINWQLSCKGVPPLEGRQSHNMYLLSIYDYFPCIVSWSSSKSLITVTTWNRYIFQVVCLNLVSYSMACSSFPHTLQIRAVACLPFRSFPSTIILWLFSIIDFVPSNPMHCNACK